MQSQITTASQWTDQPQPSRGYISFFLFFPLFLLLILVISFLSTFFTADVSVLALVVEGVTFFSLFLLFTTIFLLVLRTGYRIKYAIDAYTLHLYTGQKVAFSIPLHQISQARKIPYITRLIGWGAGRAGLCNRFRNGVCLTVSNGRRTYKLYISPSNPDEFLAHFTALKSLSDTK